jgi:molybdopterin synthase sulfur carrier subunit
MMAQINVTYRGDLAQVIGKRDEQIEAATIAEALRYIKAAYGKEAYRAAKSMLIVVNGVGIHHGKVFATQLADGDKVSFLPLAAGG